MDTVNQVVFALQGENVYRCEQNAKLLFLASAAGKDRMTAEESWQDDDGKYVFLSDDTDDFGPVHKRLEQLSPYARICWMHNTDAPYSDWEADALPARKQAGGWETRQGKSFYIYGYAFSIRGGCSMAISDDSFTIGDPDSAAELHAGTESFACTGGNASVTIPLAGKAPGALGFTLDMQGHSFPALGIGLRYFHTREGRRGDEVVAISNPLFPNARVDALCGRITPYDYFDPQKTAFSFCEGQPELAATLATVYGQGLRLQPRMGAGFAFAVHPDSRAGSGLFTCYLAPVGDFALQTGAQDGEAGGAVKILCGLSGSEYVEAAPGNTIRFHSGKPAFALHDGSELLTGKGTTSWVSFPDGNMYFSQPKKGSLYSLSGAKESFLPLFEKPVLQLSGGMDFPLMPYPGSELDPGAGIEILEEGYIAPMRKAVLGADENYAMSKQTSPKYAITPNGLVIADSGQSFAWERLILGSNESRQMNADALALAENLPAFSLTHVTGRLRSELLSSQLFMVLSEAEALMRYGSVCYGLEGADFPSMRRNEPALTKLVDTVEGYFQANDLLGKLYDSEAAFDDVLKRAAAEITQGDIAVFNRYGGKLKLTVSGWTFQLSPRNWEQHHGIFIFKYTDSHTLEELAADPRLWCFQEGYGNTDTPGRLASILQEINEQESDHEESPFDQIRSIIRDRHWQGVLMFNVPIDVDQIPSSLSSIVPGIDRSRFFAHHVGVNASNIKSEDGKLVMERSSVFGLIHYADGEDQVYTDRDYAFKTSYLMVLIANSKIQQFRCRAQFLINRLMGGIASQYPTVRGNNITLIGSCQQTDDGISAGAVYQFSLAGESHFALDSLPVESISIQAASLSYTGGSTGTGKLSLSGVMRFRLDNEFDPFSFGQRTEEGESLEEETLLEDGYLYFDNLVFRLRDTGDGYDAQPDYAGLLFDMTKSSSRSNSLAANFPIVLKEFVHESGSLPEDAGFFSISTPLRQQKMKAPWFGLRWEIDLGNLGSLARAMDLKLEFLTAWCSPGGETAGGEKLNPNGGPNLGLYDTDPFYYFGLRFPGASSLPQLPLQGIMSLGFKSVQFFAQQDPDSEAMMYYLRMRSFALRLLGLAFPPGNNDIFLFGNPNQQSKTKLGWYAAYALHSEDDHMIRKDKRLPKTKQDEHCKSE